MDMFGYPPCLEAANVNMGIELEGLLCGLEPPVDKDMTGRLAWVCPRPALFFWDSPSLGSRIAFQNTTSPQRCARSFGWLFQAQHFVAGAQQHLGFETQLAILETLHPRFIVFRFGNSHLKFYYTQTCWFFFDELGQSKWPGTLEVTSDRQSVGYQIQGDRSITCASSRTCVVFAWTLGTQITWSHRVIHG